MNLDLKGRHKFVFHKAFEISNFKQISSMYFKVTTIQY